AGDPRQGQGPRASRPGLRVQRRLRAHRRGPAAVGADRGTFRPSPECERGPGASIAHAPGSDRSGGPAMRWGSHRAFLTLLLALAAGCRSDWPEYAPEGGRYKVRMPGTPCVDKDPDLPEGVHKVSLAQRSGHYAVAYQDLPEGGALSA